MKSIAASSGEKGQRSLLSVAQRTDAGLPTRHARDVPRPSNADLFFAELTGRRPRRTRRGGLGRGDGEWSEDAPARSAVTNPGDLRWIVMNASVPAKRDKQPWAAAIRQKTDYFSDYTGWERRSEALTIEKVSVGTSFDLIIAANVKGRLKGTEDGLYIMDATVTALKPQDFSATRRQTSVVDVEVGFEDAKKKLHSVKASWDFSKGCARLDIPVRVTYRAAGLPPDEFTITWFGNGDAPITPFSPSP